MKVVLFGAGKRLSKLIDKKIFDEYEKKTTLESKIVNMLDKVNSAIPFLKYDGEKLIDGLNQYKFSPKSKSEMVETFDWLMKGGN